MSTKKTKTAKSAAPRARTSHTPAPETRGWAYAMLSASGTPEEIGARLSAMGADGWELAAMSSIPRGAADAEHFFAFKRPAPVRSGEGLRAAEAAGLPLTRQAKLDLLWVIARLAESGDAGFAAVNPNKDKNGLSWGFIQFAQKPGMLGDVLTACQEADPTSFGSVFGPDGEQLLEVTTADKADDRMKPIAGKVLWEAPWLDRFTAAGGVTKFQRAQEQIALDTYVERNLRIAYWLGFTTDRALVMLFDRCIQGGVVGGRKFVLEAVGPIASAEDQKTALKALGFKTLADFQRSVHLEPDGKFGPESHAAMIFGLRAMGASSPFEIPTLPAMLDALPYNATDERIGKRIRMFRATPQLHDVDYDLPKP